MGYIVTHFIPTLCDTSDASLAACVSRLQTYISQRQWLKEPKGRKLPRCVEPPLTREFMNFLYRHSYACIHMYSQWITFCSVLG